MNRRRKNEKFLKEKPCIPWIKDTGLNDAVVRQAADGALQRAVRSFRDRNLSTEEIAEIHRVLTAPVVPVGYYAGGIRQDSSRYRCLAQDVEVGGIPGSHFREVLVDLARLCHEYAGAIATYEARLDEMRDREKARGLALVTAKMVAGFIRVHPFLNGNGRTSRIIWAAILATFGFVPQHDVTIRPAPPYPELMAQAMRGDVRLLVASIVQYMLRHPPTLES